MKKNTLFTLLLTIVAMMWASSTSASIVLAGQWLTRTSNVIGQGITGKVHYDAKNKVLTLTNAHIKYRNGVLTSNDEGLKLIVKGNCSFTDISPQSKSTVLLKKSMTITGGGTLTIEGPGMAIDLNTNATANLTIIDCSVTAKSDIFGIIGSPASTLIIHNATVKATGRQFGSIRNWGDIKLEGCKIVQPADATIDNTTGYNAVMSGGAVVNKEVVIVPDGTLSIIIPTVDVPANKRGIYTLDGIRLTSKFENLPEGVYIVNGRKMVKK